MGAGAVFCTCTAIVTLWISRGIGRIEFKFWPLWGRYVYGLSVLNPSSHDKARFPLLEDSYRDRTSQLVCQSINDCTALYCTEGTTDFAGMM